MVDEDWKKNFKRKTIFIFDFELAWFIRLKRIEWKQKRKLKTVSGAFDLIELREDFSADFRREIS